MFIFVFVTNLALAGAFSFHISQEPGSLDPALISSVDLNLLFSNIYRGLYRYDGEKGLVSEGAKSCRYTQKKLNCELKPLKWSDGSPIVANHYVQAFRHIMDPKVRSRETEKLISLLNAKNILAGQKPIESLGVRAEGDLKLVFDFEELDYDFLYKLSSSSLVPWKNLPTKELVISNGPYIMKNWEKQKISLTKNSQYLEGNPHRPDVDVYFFDEDIVAVNFFDLKKMSLIRRIPTDLKPKYQKMTGYFTYTPAQFDYIGFGPTLGNATQLRKALSLSLNFPEFQTLMNSIDRPGCPGFPRSYSLPIRCQSFNLSEAKNQLKNVTEESKKSLFLAYTHSDDIKRGMEWFQNQWHKYLEIKVELRPVERGMFNQYLSAHLPPIFRRSVALDRPTCLAGLEVFQSHHSDNFIHLQSKEYDRLIEKWRRTENQLKRKEFCQKAFHMLISDYRLIPLGQYEFGAIVDPKFKGFKINEMVQLDLSNLEEVK